MWDASDLPRVDLRDLDSTTQIMTGLAVHGITIFHRGAGRDELLHAAQSLITIRTHRDSDPDGVTAIVQRPSVLGATGLTGFTDHELWPHTDGSAVDRPPRVLMLACVRPARAGGHSHLVDGRDLYDEIAATDPVMLTALSAPRTAYFGGSSGHLGAVFEQTDQGRVSIRLRLDEMARFSPTVRPYADRLRTLVQDRTVAVDLRAGDGYIVLNDRWLHGRSWFTGQRLMLRVLGDPMPHVALPGGFRPTVTPRSAALRAA